MILKFERKGWLFKNFNANGEEVKVEVTMQLQEFEDFVDLQVTQVNASKKLPFTCASLNEDDCKFMVSFLNTCIKKLREIKIEEEKYQKAQKNER